MGGFLSGFADQLSESIDKKHKQEEAQKDAVRNFYFKALADPNIDDDQRAHAEEQYTKLLNPETKKGYQRLAPMMAKIIGLHRAPKTVAGAPTVGAPPQDSAAPALTPGAVPATPEQQVSAPSQRSAAPEPVAVPAPSPTPEAKAAFMAGPPKAPMASVYKNYGVAASRRKLESDLEAARRKREDEIKAIDSSDLSPEEKKQAKKAVFGVKEQTPVNLQRAEVELADGTKVPGFVNPRDGTVHGLDGNVINPANIKALASGPQNNSVRNGQQISRNDAMKIVADGLGKFTDADGQEIDPSKLPEGTALQAILSAKGVHYVPVSPNQKTVTVGNKVYSALPTDLMHIPEGAGQELGTARVATQSTGNTPVYNPETGQFEMLTTHTSSTPSSPGAARAPVAPTPVAPIPTTVAPPAPLVQRPAAAATPKPAAAPTPGARSMGNLIPAGQLNRVIDRAIPVQEAATQIFGDPNQPDLKPLMSYRNLADNKDSRARLGKALRLTFDGLNSATGGAGIHASAGPVSVSSGGFGDLLQNYFNVAPKVAEQQQQIMNDALTALTPEEREYYNSVMSSFSTIVGLRSLTRASAAQASVAAIERELPVIGVNTVDSNQFADQLQRLSEVVANGVKSIPKGGFDQKIRQRIEQLPKEMQALKRGGAAATKAVKQFAPSAAPKTAEDYLKKLNEKK